METTTVEMLTSISGPRCVAGPGDDYTCDAEEAQRLIDRGYAKAKGDTPDAENRKGEPAAEAATVDAKPKRRGRPPQPAKGGE